MSNSMWAQSRASSGAADLLPDTQHVPTSVHLAPQRDVRDRLRWLLLSFLGYLAAVMLS